jgi:hypothetical protein
VNAWKSGLSARGNAKPLVEIEKKDDIGANRFSSLFGVSPEKT